MKSRMSVVDCRRMVHDLKSKILNMWVHNVYDINSKTFQFKLSVPGKDKVQLLIEAGVRFHTTQYVRGKSEFPSGFSMKLRKHIRGKKLSNIQQAGFDRVIILTFGYEQFSHHIIVELYASGNVILTDNQFTILSTLRTHSFDGEAKIAVREKYPFTTLAWEFPPLTEEIVAQSLEEGVVKSNASFAKQKGHRKLKLLQTLMKIEDFKTCGKDLLQHCLLEQGIDSGLELSAEKLKQMTSNFEFLKDIRDAIVAAQKIIEEKLSAVEKGYIIAEEGKDKSDVYISFLPLKMKQYAAKKHIEFTDFDTAVDEYFSKLETQRDDRQGEAVKRAAQKKLEKVKVEQTKRIESLQQNIVEKELAAEVLANNVTTVENAVLVIRSALANGMGWDELEKLVKAEKAKKNPVASIIYGLNLEKNEIILALEHYDVETDEHREVKVNVDIGLSAHANINSLYDEKKKAAFKAEKTVETSERVVELAKKKAEETVKRQQTSRSGIEIGRKTHWYEKFNWFLTREGVLVLCGRDAQQNELLVKRYLRKNYRDVYVHADLHGAPSCVVRNPRMGSKISLESLKEAGIMTVCRSSAWKAKIITSAWWVYADQVSKTAPTGEYLPTGSFMIRGKKNFLPPCRLELSFGYIFKIDETQPSAASRKCDWRLIEDVNREERLSAKLDAAIKRRLLHPTEEELNSTKNQHSQDAENETNSEADDGDIDIIGARIDIAKDSINRDEKQGNSQETSRATEVESSLITGISQYMNIITKEESNSKAITGTNDSAIEAPKRLSAFERKMTRKSQDRKGLESEENNEIGKNKADAKQKGSNGKTTKQQKVRGKKGKDKKKKKKYAEQTEEERNLAMAALGNPIKVNDFKADNDKVCNEDEQKNSKAHKLIIKSVGKNEPKRGGKAIDNLDEGELAKLNSSEFDLHGFTYDPKPDDTLLYALPVCGPTSSMLGYKFRVKLVPGSMKRGKAIKTAVELLCRLPNCSRRESGLIRSVAESTNVQTIIGDAKISAPGVNAGSRAIKSKKKSRKN